MHAIVPCSLVQGVSPPLLRTFLVKWCRWCRATDVKQRRPDAETVNQKRKIKKTLAVIIRARLGDAFVPLCPGPGACDTRYKTTGDTYVHNLCRSMICACVAPTPLPPKCFRTGGARRTRRFAPSWRAAAALSENLGSQQERSAYSLLTCTVGDLR